MSCSENIPADASPVKRTPMFAVSVNFFTYFQRWDVLTRALSSSAGVNAC